MKTTVLSFLFTISSIGICTAYPSSDNRVIKGRVMESDGKTPISYATIALLNTSDSSVVNGTTSMTNGVFEFKNIADGEYIASISFVGYDTHNSENITFLKEESVDIGDILLNVSHQLLDEVIVTSSQPRMEYHVDKKIIAVSQMLTSASMSAVEVLENTPSIRTDVDGNVSLRGSSDFTVLIDGKPTILDANDALKQIPASSIHNIEIITNPSAKYEPDGTGGIINVVLKKNAMQGLQGVVNLGYGTLNQYNTDIALNYNFANVGLYARAEVGASPRHNESSLYRETTVDGVTTSTESEGTTESIFKRNNFRVGTNWDITNNDKLSVETGFGRWIGDGNGTSIYQTISQTEAIKDNSINSWMRGSDFISAVINYEHRFEQEGHKLMLQGYYGYREFEEKDETTLSDDYGTISSGAIVNNVSPMTTWNIKLDYTKPFENSKLEIGTQFRLGGNESNVNQSVYDIESLSFVDNPLYNQNTMFTNQIASLYSTYDGTLGRLGYMAGMRVEHNFRETKSLIGGESYSLDMFDFFPTAHLSYKLDDKNQLMASYSRRINRPRGWNLEPFYTWSDMFNVRIGNPLLQPEYIDAMEIGYALDLDRVQFSTEAYYRIRNNKIESIRSPFEDAVVLTTYDNVGKDFSLGVEAMLTAEISKWWDISLSGSIYDYRLVVDLEENPYEVESLNWNNRLSNTIYIADWLRFQFDGSYNSATATAQGREKGYFSFNAALRGDFMNRALSVSLQGRNIFGTTKYSSETISEGLYQLSNSTPYAPTFSITLSYRLNNFRQNKDFEGDDFM